MARISAALRQRVAAAAGYRCGYCLTSQRIVGPLLEIDHIIPESRGGTDNEDNLFLACPMCNSHKAEKVEAFDTGTATIVALFNPRTERWQDHFRWIDDGAVVEGVSAIGRATVDALVMNHPEIVAARRLWVLAGWHPPIDES